MSGREGSSNWLFRMCGVCMLFGDEIGTGNKHESLWIFFNQKKSYHNSIARLLIWKNVSNTPQFHQLTKCIAYENHSINREQHTFDFLLFLS